MKAVVAAFNQEKALVGAFSVITNLRMQFGCNFLKHYLTRYPCSVSPLMGPILAGIFGGAVRDSHLTWSGIRHEVYALMICILIGFLLGLAIVPWIHQYGVHQFPTSEMRGRGELRSVLEPSQIFAVPGE